jgi:CIC family chloride channel protein
LLAGPIATVYTRLIYAFQDLFHNLMRIPDWLKPALAGALVGGVGIFLPQIFGVGYSSIEQVLGNAPLTVCLLLVLMMAKLVMTPVSLAGGFRGGVFAPAIFIGAMLGGAVGRVSAFLFPTLNIAPQAFAMVGMAALLAGVVHAPLTAILLLFEMTQDYRIILPLMAAVVVSLLVSSRLQKDSVYALGLARKGIRLERGRDVEVLETVLVNEVMQDPPISLKEHQSLGEASEVFINTRHHGLPVTHAQNKLVGVFTLQDLDNAPTDSWESKTVGELYVHNLLVAYPNETIGVALRRMGATDLGRLPVVERAAPSHLVGWLRRVDLLRAYDVALTRRETVRHRIRQIKLDAVTSHETGVEELCVVTGAACDGKPIHQILWPPESLIVSVRRGRQTIIPRGDTVLQASDVVIVVTTPEHREKMHRIILEAKT